MRKTIIVPSSEIKVVRCPQWDEKHGSECWGLKPNGYNAYYCVGSKEECEAELEKFKQYEKEI